MPQLREVFLNQLIEGLRLDTLDNPRKSYQSPEGIVRFVVDVLKANPTPYQAEILSTFVERKRMAVRAPHGAGKCLGWDEWVTLADGSRQRAHELIGKTFSVPSFNDQWERVNCLARAEDNGIEPVYQIETQSGRTIIRTGNHPLWADLRVINRVKPQGNIGSWEQVQDLTVWSKVAVVGTADEQVQKWQHHGLPEWATWERVMRVTALPPQRTVAIEVPETNTFLTDFVEHNTALSAWVVLWAMSVFDTDTKVVTTASAWRQVKYFTWKEIHLWASRGDWKSIGVKMDRGKQLLDLSMNQPNNRSAFAVASDNPALIEGAHATTLVYVFDEAKAIPPAIWDAAEGAFSNAGLDTQAQAYALAISTPGEPSGRFYDIQAHKKGYEDWATRHITLAEAIQAGRISQTWVKARQQQWGINSAVYKNRVEGEFDSSGEDSVIPLAWIERANERWYEKEGKGEGNVYYGVDPAYKGEDSTTICKLVGRVVESIQSNQKQSTMETAGRVAAQATKEYPLGIDVIGIGAGVFDRLKELGYNAHAVNVANKTPYTTRTAPTGFVNLRCALWWMIREALDPDQANPLALPPDDELTGDLITPQWSYKSDGKIWVQSKDEIREKLGRSPDKADSVALALYMQLMRGAKLVMV